MNLSKLFTNTVFLFVVVVILAFILRFVNLASIPNGLYPDETAIGYNAYSILESGKDEYGTPYPLYFRSYDDFKLPFYIYSTSLAMKFFGVNEFSVRFTSMLFGVISVGILFLLILELSKSKYFAFLGALFLTFNPWHLYFSRAGYEVNVATSLILIGVYLFILALSKKQKTLYLALSAIFFALSVYTYNVTRLIAPIIFLSLLIFYIKLIKKESPKAVIVSLILFFAGLIPFVVSFFTLQSNSGFSAHTDLLILGNAQKAEFIETRSYYINLPPIISKILFNTYILMFWTYLKNLVAFFSTGFYFVTGSDKPSQNLTTMAMFYFFEFPLIVYGIYYSIKNRVKFMLPIAIWLVSVLIFGSIIKVFPNGTRTFPAVIPITVFSSYGLYLVLLKIRKIKKRYIKLLTVTSILFIILYSYIYFLMSYYVRLPIEDARDWKSEDRKVSEFIKSIEKNYKKVVFLENSELVYTSYFFYSKYPPENYHKNAEYTQKGLVNTLKSVGKYEFDNVDLKKQLPEYNTLYVTKKEKLPDNVTVIKEFNYPARPLGIYYDRKIGQLSVEDNAYVIFDYQMK